MPSLVVPFIATMRLQRRHLVAVFIRRTIQAMYILAITFLIINIFSYVKAQFEAQEPHKCLLLY